MQSIKNSIVNWTRKFFDLVFRNTMNTVIHEIRTDLFAAQILSPLIAGFVPWTKPALRPGVLATILNDIVINRRIIIVECGGGVSTIYIARLLKQLGRGHLFTIEHDANWIVTLKELVIGEKDHVTFVYAPMEPLKSINSGDWYSETIVLSALRGSRIDLLLVDGPPVIQENKMIRYPALPIFKELFSDNYAIVLDDVNRRGEHEILSKWQNELPLEFHIVSGAAIGLLPTAYKSYL